MAKEICISSTPHETRLAILEDDQLAEIYYERENEYTLAGSVYKGRVTRVLPGMQSAFVDIGLERDAFLYVTDFLEMEDQEDTDEVERAASQGDTQRPQLAQPVAQASQAQTQQNQGRGGREGQRDGQRDGQREGRDQRPRRGESRPPLAEGEPTAVPFQVPTAVTINLTPLATDSDGVPSSVSQAVQQQDETDEQGARRWRGRRRRRGGRGRDEAGSPVSGTESAEAQEFSAEEEVEEAEISPFEFEAAASQPVAAPAVTPFKEQQRAEREPRVQSSAPTPFLLPGESLSKYGSAAAPKPAPSRLILSELPPDTSPAPPERTVTKPSTLIETEFVWDGKGLLPGESIARHRKVEAAPEPVAVMPEVKSASVDAEPQGVFADSAEGVKASEAATVSDGAIVAEIEDAAPETWHEETVAVEHLVEVPDFSEAYEEEEVSPEDELSLVEAEAEAEFEAGFTSEAIEAEFSEIEVSEHPVEHAGAEATEEHEPEINAPTEGSASHNVDPLPPSGFRLKDIFGGRKKEEAPTPAPKPARTVSTVSAYAPDGSVVEEEVIEDEEYEFTPIKAHHGEEHDLEELEEETLQQQIRSGALGEMLQEAHLDHRIEIDSEDDEEADLEEEGSPAQAGGRGRTAAAPGTGGRDRGDGRGGDRSGGRDSRGRRGGRSGSGAGSSSGGGEGRRGPGGAPSSGGMSRRSAQTSDLPIISDLLKPGQEILVQIAKEPIAKKGARITSHIALPGRFLVFMPTVSHVGVSRKIASDEERQRLKRVLVSEKGDAQGGFIVRTAAEGASEDELRSDLRFLINLWNDIKQRADTSKPPALIYHDLNLIERILRDQVSDNFSHIWVDSEADYERIVRFLNRFSPELVRRVKLYTKEVPLFEHFGIQDEISKALRSKVWLKSGGSIVINQTEALVAIDINTGKFVGKTARLEDTILKTNLDAIPEIVRQIRLRDLGGIIVIDFIDMDERKNRTRVMTALEEALKQDRAPTKVLQFNDFGLVAITRKRVKQSLERTLSVPCPVCQATGMVKSPATVANEIYIEVRKMRKHFDGTEVLVRVNPETAKALKANNAKWLTELEDLAGKNVLVKSDATLHPEQFDIQG